ncbi:MAG: hypothetical protein M3361_18100, partial [Candidatus Tectomicrobia bacterium]|nr:hypothetical protein [Candidatus Tectomicrobia bacterium]
MAADDQAEFRALLGGVRHDHVRRELQVAGGLQLGPVGRHQRLFGQLRRQGPSEELLHLRLDEVQGGVLKPVDVVEHDVDHDVAFGAPGEGGNVSHGGALPARGIDEQKRRVGPDQPLNGRDMRPERAVERVDLHPPFRPRQQVAQSRKRRRVLLHKRACTSIP